MALFEGVNIAEYAVLAEELSKQIATLQSVAEDMAALTKPVAVKESKQKDSGEAYIYLYI